MFNRELVVIDPISFVPMVLLACAVTIAGRAHAKFPLAEKESIYYSLPLLIKHSLCRRTLRKTTEKLQDLTVGGGDTQVG